MDMPVPCSYNDVTQDRSLRDFVGWVWYDKEFFPPNSWSKSQTQNRVVLRFDSAHYNTIVVSVATCKPKQQFWGSSQNLFCILFLWVFLSLIS